LEIALLINNGKANLFNSDSYENEIEMQDLVKSHPSIINISSIFDSQILIVGRESWRIDVLAITSTCVPVIIECKRKDNPDMRYLIAQIFEYASLLQTKSYSEFEQEANKYYKSQRCLEKTLCNNSFYENFKSFLNESNNDDYAEDDGFQRRIEENIKSGQFYCVIVVDSLDSVTRRSINFFNSKLDKFRIEVIEIKKLSSNETSLYIPFHANPEIEKTKKKTAPGRITYEEMLKSGSLKQNEFIKNIVDFWCSLDDCSYEMGTSGMSLRIKGFSIFWLFINRIHIANPLGIQLQKSNFDDSIVKEIKDSIKNKFGSLNIVFDEKNVDLNPTLEFINSVYKKIYSLVCVSNKATATDAKSRASE